MGKKCFPCIICIENMTLFVLFVILLLVIYIYYNHHRTQTHTMNNAHDKVVLVNTQSNIPQLVPI